MCIIIHGCLLMLSFVSRMICSMDQSKVKRHSSLNMSIVYNKNQVIHAGNKRKAIRRIQTRSHITKLIESFSRSNSLFFDQAMARINEKYLKSRAISVLSNLLGFLSYDLLKVVISSSHFGFLRFYAKRPLHFPSIIH